MSRRDTYLARRASARLKKRLIGAAFFAAAVGVIVLGLLVEPEKAIAGYAEVVDAPRYVQAAPSAPVTTVAAAAAARRVYPYSIIPGGVADREELARVIKIDKVVADHYANFGVDKAFKVTVTKPRAVYVSYRKDDKVYWTSKKLMLVKGELLLSDGQNEMRARCANRISDTPQLPVEMNEPSAEELDSVLAISMDPEALGLNDGDYAPGGAGFGPGPGQASSITLAANDAAAAAGMGGGARGAGGGAGPAPGRNNFFGPAAGSSPGTGGAPGDSDSGEQGTSPADPTAPGSTPGTPSPELTPGKPATPGTESPATNQPGSNPPQAGKPPPGESPTDIPPGNPPGNPPSNPETPMLPPDVPEPPGLPPTELPTTELPQVPGEIEHQVPEPNSLALCALAFAAMLVLRRKKPARPAR